ncbi:hypothetical protein I4F81_009513 [Pyropia yezoensis]|uniref:Uncharacterized protein n=1 Tax=Pyropia yezoensis TaxID=2788 RepID=A0ACC3C9T2_PYRYE|nr:hypothetical protein I4F81_009513 [Neopyropia yezoensis]
MGTIGGTTPPAHFPSPSPSPPHHHPHHHHRHHHRHHASASSPRPPRRLPLAALPPRSSRPALTVGGLTLPYTSLRRAVGGVAAGLAVAGVGPGSVVRVGGVGDDDDHGCGRGGGGGGGAGGGGAAAWLAVVAALGVGRSGATLALDGEGAARLDAVDVVLDVRGGTAGVRGPPPDDDDDVVPVLAVVSEGVDAAAGLVAIYRDGVRIGGGDGAAAGALPPAPTPDDPAVLLPAATPPAAAAGAAAGGDAGGGGGGGGVLVLSHGAVAAAARAVVAAYRLCPADAAVLAHPPRSLHAAVQVAASIASGGHLALVPETGGGGGGGEGGAGQPPAGGTGATDGRAVLAAAAAVGATYLSTDVAGLASLVAAATAPGDPAGVPPGLAFVRLVLPGSGGGGGGGGGGGAV